MKEVFVTLFDQNYLRQGLALYKSLARVYGVAEFDLYVLCVDDQTHQTLAGLNWPNLKPVARTTYLQGPLQAVEAIRTRREFCWTLTSHTFDVVFSLDPICERVTYLDADLWFMKNPAPIFKELEDSGRCCLITPHYYAPEYDQSAVSGYFCVQFITFDRERSRPIRQSWKAQCLTSCSETPTADGKFGDQTYLDDWEKAFPNQVQVLQQKSAALAPWNAKRFPYSEGIFYHFHGVQPVSQNGRLGLKRSSFYEVPEPTLKNVYEGYLQDVMALDQISTQTQAANKAVSKIGEPLKIAFGMIVFEGDYVLRQVLEQIYPFAHQILIAEGPVKHFQDLGKTTSEDRTNAILKGFPDPQNKISVVHGQFSEKDEQSNAYMKHLDPQVDYLWQVDSDECYKSGDIAKVIAFLSKQHPNSVGVQSCSFYGGFEHYLTGFELNTDNFLRVFRVYPGSYWKTHRPPTMAHAQEVMAGGGHVSSDTLFKETGVKMYHYYYE